MLQSSSGWLTSTWWATQKQAWRVTCQLYCWNQNINACWASWPEGRKIWILRHKQELRSSTCCNIITRSRCDSSFSHANWKKDTTPLAHRLTWWRTMSSCKLFVLWGIISLQKSIQTTRSLWCWAVLWGAWLHILKTWKGDLLGQKGQRPCKQCLTFHLLLKSPSQAPYQYLQSTQILFAAFPPPNLQLAALLLSCHSKGSASNF